VRFGLAALVLVLLAGLGGKVAVAAAASRSCADQVIADWYDDGRVGKIYPLACYQQAIKKLPPDVLDYSNAKEEIGRALAFARQGKPDPGGTDPSPSGTNTTSTTPSTGTTGTSTTKTSSTSTSTTQTTKTTPETTNVFTPASTSTTDTSGPSSVPVPLLILGGLAILLLAAGSAGYLRRRMGGGSGDDGAPPTGA